MSCGGLDHVGMNVSDIAKSKAFYTAALAPLGYKLLMDSLTHCGFARDHKPDFWLASSNDTTKPVCHGLHVAFGAPSRAVVDAWYEAAMAAGAKDNGKPGPRPQFHPGYYGAFVLDLDGNNIEAVCHHT